MNERSSSKFRQGWTWQEGFIARLINICIHTTYLHEQWFKDLEDPKYFQSNENNMFLHEIMNTSMSSSSRLTLRRSKIGTFL